MPGTSSTPANVGRAWLDGNAADSVIGHYFPARVRVDALHSTRVDDASDLCLT